MALCGEPSAKAATGAATADAMPPTDEWRVISAPASPGDQRHDPGQRHGGERHAEQRRHAFTAPEAQPDRVTMADEGRNARQHPGLEPAIMARQQHGGGALAGIEQQRRRRQPLVAGAQHIGGADIARSDRADIDADRPRQQQPERNTAEQIADADAGG